METTSKPTSTPLAADDPRRFFAAAVALGGQVVGAVRPDQLPLPTPCPAYDVRQLMGHLVAVLRRVAAVGMGRPAFSVPQVIEGVADDAWAASWADAAHEVQAVWSDDAVLTRDLVLPWATLPGAVMLRTYVNEVTVHTWDLATATGQRPDWDDEVLAVAFAAIQLAMPAGDRLARFEAMRADLPPQASTMPPPYLEAIEPPHDAALIDRLVAWNGRPV